MPSDQTLNAWIVEDEPSFRDTLQLLLSTDGFRCGAAFASIEEALAWIEVAPRPMPPSERPDVMLLDVNLPGMNGVEGVGALKARLPATRIVMLTIRDDAATIAAALQAGASGYLLKSSDVDQVRSALREAYSGGMLMPAPVARIVMERFRREAPAADYGLTPREQEVLAEMVNGYTQKEIGDRLAISPSTVNNHVQRIYEKLHVHSGNAAVAKAMRERLVEGGRR